MFYLTATGRNDWESQLAFSEASSFFYPSVGLSGVISSMARLPEWISFLKVRGSYTEVGTSFERFITRPTYEFNIASGKWSSTSIYPMRNLKPEKTRSWEFGLNSKWLDNRLSFDLTYYKSNTINQTFTADLSISSGYSKAYIQSGNVRNEGIETVSYTHLDVYKRQNTYFSPLYITSFCAGSVINPSCTKLK